jgi:hypothetical protein
VFTLSALVVLLAQGVAEAQVQVTPNFSLTPSKTVTPWVYQMAVLTVIIGALVLIGLGVSYMRFAPRFFGRRESPGKLPPGTRPPLLTQGKNLGEARVTRPAVASSSGGSVAVAERPAPAAPAPPRAAEPAPAAAVAAEPAAAEASPAPTAGPQGEPAAQADAVGEAEAAAPEARPSAKTPEEVGESPEEVEQAQEAPAQPAAAPAQASGGPSGMDQETFDRVLEEQLSKGVDRRVAEGRARAAAVVAARKKSQG